MLTFSSFPKLSSSILKNSWPGKLKKKEKTIFTTLSNDSMTICCYKCVDVDGLNKFRWNMCAPATVFFFVIQNTKKLIYTNMVSENEYQN